MVIRPSTFWSYPLFWINLFSCTYLTLTALNYITGNQFEFLSIKKNRLLISSRTCTMGHALSSLYLSSRVLFGTDPMWTINNTPAQNHMLANSIGYFIYDFIYINSCEFSWIFNAHHLITLTCIGTQYYFNITGYQGAQLIFLGEITNPIQIIWDVTRIHRSNSAICQYIYDELTPLHVYFFLLIRGLVLPVASLYHNYIWITSPIDQRLAKLWLILTLLLNGASCWWIRMIKTKYIDKKKLSKD